MKVTFFLHGQRGRSHVVCQVRHDGKKYYRSTGVQWPEDGWDRAAQRPIPRSRNDQGMWASALTARLDSTAALVESLAGELLDGDPGEFVRLFRLAVSVSREETDEAGMQAARPGPGEGVVALYGEFMESGKAERRWKENTVQNYRVLLKHLALFDRDLYVTELGFQGLARFHAYLTGLGLADSAVHDYFKCLLSFLNWAEKNGHEVDRSFREFSFKTRWNTGDVVFLTVGELSSLSSLALPERDDAFEAYGIPARPGLSNDFSAVRDMFVFCCLTGLRFSDMQELDWSNVVGDELHIVAKKTGRKSVVNLFPVPEAIMERYGRSTSGKVFPRVSNAFMNRLLKVLGRMAGIDAPVGRIRFSGRSGKEEATSPKWKRITTHTGRHTFVANALSMGIPSQVVMAWTGHASERTMSPYVAFTDSSKRSAMGKLEAFWHRFLG